MSNYKSQAIRLINNGFKIVPSQYASKAPIHKGWQEREFTADDVQYGFAIKTGNGVLGLDVDVLDVKIADDVIDYITMICGYTIQRVGRAPKTMLVYRGDSKKQVSNRYKDADGNTHMIEVQGDGQKFEAFGIHADTKQEYRWTDFYDGDLAVKELPEIKQSDIDMIFDYFDDLAQKEGWQLVGKSTKSGGDDSREAGEKTGMPIDKARRMVMGLPAVSYDEFISVGMGLHAEYDGSDEAFAIWHDWDKALYPDSDEKQLRAKWDSFGAGKVTLRSMTALHRKLVAYPMTDVGALECFVNTATNNIKYSPQVDKFYEFAGANWQESHAVDTQVCNFLKNYGDELLVNDGKPSDMLSPADKKAISWGKRVHSFNMLTNLPKALKSYPDLRVDFNQFDSRLEILGVGNGTINLNDGTFSAPSPDDYLLTFTAVNYDPTATCPLWEQTILDVFAGDEELAEYLQRAIGYSITGRPNEHKIFVPYGGGANGKSTVFNTISYVLGAYATSVDSSVFAITDNKGSPREDLLNLRGKRFVYATELEENAVLQESLVKSMTGGDTLKARGLYSKNYIEFKPTWSVFMPTNHKPVIKGNDEGIWRRIELIPFLVDFRKTGTRDLQRDVKLKAEASGILNWVLKGVKKYHEIGLATPDVVKQATADYREDMDLLGEWLASCCEFDDEYTATSMQLWASWHNYAHASGDLRYIPTRNLLGRKLSTKFQPMRTNKLRGFRGLRLKTDEFDVE